MCLIMLMINSSPVQLEAKVGELELEPVEEAPLYRLEELRERLGDVQIWLTKVQDRVEDVSQRLVKIQTIYANEVWLKYSYDTSEEWSRVTLLKGRKKHNQLWTFACLKSTLIDMQSKPRRLKIL